MVTNNIVSENLKVLVFRTNIDSKSKVMLVRKKLLKTEEIYRVDIDLEDYENVLRVECHPDISVKQMETKISDLGFNSSELTVDTLHR